MNATLSGALLGLAAFGMFGAVDMSIKVLGAGYSPFQINFFVSLMTCPIAPAQAMPTEPNKACGRTGRV